MKQESISDDQTQMNKSNQGKTKQNITQCLTAQKQMKINNE
jgi:hypothetical protein